MLCPFSLFFGFAYSPLNSAKICCSSEGILIIYHTSILLVWIFQNTLWKHSAPLENILPHYELHCALVVFYCMRCTWTKEVWTGKKVVFSKCQSGIDGLSRKLHTCCCKKVTLLELQAINLNKNILPWGWIQFQVPYFRL